MVMNVQSGDVDGTDVSGTTSALAGDWPSGFLSGNGTARFYFDPDVSAEQRSALESVFRGERGGVFEILAALVPNFLPSKEAPIDIQAGEDSTHIRVGDFGAIVVSLLRGPEGDLTTVRHAPGAFVPEFVLAKGTGTSWRDPELREWSSGGHAERAEFDWRA